MPTGNKPILHPRIIKVHDEGMINALPELLSMIEFQDTRVQKTAKFHSYDLAHIDKFMKLNLAPQENVNEGMVVEQPQQDEEEQRHQRDDVHEDIQLEEALFVPSPTYIPTVDTKKSFLHRLMQNAAEKKLRVGVVSSSFGCSRTASHDPNNVVMRISWNPMGQVKSDEHPPYVELTERKAAEFAALKQRGLTVAEYEVQFSRLSRYAVHLIGTKRMKAKHFLNGLRPQYITQLAPMDIQTYADMIKKAQLLEDAMETAERIKGKSVKREQVSATGMYQPTIGKKRPSGGVNEPADKKPKDLGKQIVVATRERDRAGSTMKYPGDREQLFHVVMRISWNPMGQGKSDEHPPYEELTV
ncbi:hypothetical protein Taro_046260 [Colocasia esculenta]|uniref:Retrotransposon gag domain-containing protein n=1 Tax=Colocasia esculenta TaxID=4460 RepID=A0A843WPD3_COLES|nr:hypothetical protein [Colocasia esculenta]